jgi:hypothetical protein
LVEQKQIFLEFGIASLFKYCVEILDLSKGVSYELVAVIHKGREVPEIKEAVKKGDISLSKAKKICSVVTASDHKQWLELARVETSRVVEKCVALARPQAIIESAVYKTEDRLQFQLGVSEAWMTELAEVKNLLSQQQKGAVSSEDAIQFLMREFLQKNEPLKKAERALKRASKRLNRESDTNQKFPGTVGVKFDELNIEDTVFSATLALGGPKLAKARTRKKIKRITLHAVNARDLHQCTYVGIHGRCEEKRWLDVHHKVPVVHGGGDDLENLTTLCRRHHVRHHA